MKTASSRRLWLNIALLVTSGLGYLEWANQRTILYAVEWDLLAGVVQKGSAFAHPAVALPFLGQLLLIFAILTNPEKLWRTYLACVGIGMLHLVILYIGILNANWLMIASVVPFLALSVLAVVGKKNFK